MKIFHSPYSGKFYKNRVEAVNDVADRYYSDHLGQDPGRVRAVLINQIDVGVIKKQPIVDLLNGDMPVIYDADDVETVAKIWLEGSASNAQCVVREKAQTGIVYRNIKTEQF